MKDKLYISVVSLRSSEKRRKQVKYHLKNINILDFFFFDAVNGKELLAKDYFSYFKNLRGRALNKKHISPSELGCTLSHLEVYKNFLNSDKEWLLVLEDDIYIDNTDNIYYIKDMIKNEKCINYINILGGQEGMKRAKIFKYFYRGKTLLLPSPWFGFLLYRTCCYLISKTVALKLVNIHTKYCYIADDWGNLALDANIAGFTYSEIFNHPMDLSDSLIENERLI